MKVSRGVKKEVERALAAALSELGYTRVEERVFRAPWSTEAVDHFVYLRWLSKYGPAISADIGIRHRAAQDFAAPILKELGPYVTRLFQEVKGTTSLVGFPLGRLCDWPIPWAFYPGGIGPEACVRNIVDSLEGKLRPLVSHVGDDTSMYAYLTQIENPGLWAPNGAARAAEAIFIGKRLNYPQARVFADVQRFENYISSSIDDDLTVEDFLRQVWARA